MSVGRGLLAYPWLPPVKFNFIIPDILERLLYAADTILDRPFHSVKKGIHDFGEDVSLHL